ncbi:hypothetical protein JCM11672_28270 [Alkaliphilus crotonatoxidans]
MSGYNERLCRHPVEFWYDFDYLSLYIKKLSEKQTLSKDDFKNLSQLVSLGEKLYNSSKISEGTSFLSKKIFLAKM